MLLLDGSHLLHRQLHTVLGDMKNSSGVRVGGIYGVLQSMWGLSRRWKNSMGSVVCWDLGCSEYRMNLYDNYKERSGSRNDPDMISENFDYKSLDEFDAIYYWTRKMLHTKILPLCGVVSLQIRGVEADDIIAWLAMNVKSDSRKVIVTTDGDMHQLVCHDTDYYNPIQEEYYTEQSIIDSYKLEKDNWRTQFVISKSIIGDGSDNIPGTPKCGWGTAPKIAKVLMDTGDWEEVGKSHLVAWKNAYENREQTLRNIELIDLHMLPKEYREKIRQHIAMATMLEPSYDSEDALHQLLYNLELNKPRTFIGDIIQSNQNSSFRDNLKQATR